MEEAKKPPYKYCMVPKCKNTIRSTPYKVFFRIPTNVKVRKQWCKMMRRDNVSQLSCLYCCEDHFNVKEDAANYVEYKIMKQQGEKCNLRLKKGVVPHIFWCQKRNMPPPAPVERMGVIKRQRLALVNEALSEFAFKSSNECEPPQRSDNKANPNTFYTNVCDINEAEPTSCIEVCDPLQAEACTSHIEDKLQSDKAVQVNIKLKYRSKSVNVNIQTEKKNIGTSPIKLSVLNKKKIVHR